MISPSNPPSAGLLLRQALAQIIAHRGSMVSTFALIWILQFPSFIGGESFLPTEALALLGLPLGAANTAAAVAVMVVVYLGTAWSAVGWHRLSMLGEAPAGVLPRWRPRQVVSYLVSSIIIPFVAWLMPVILGFALYAALTGWGVGLPVRLALLIPFAVVGIWSTFRLCPALVARAVGQQMTITEATARTAGLSRALWGLAAICTLLTAVLFSVIGAFPADEESIYFSRTAALADGLIACLGTFIFFLVTISLFNVIYRHSSPETPA